MFVPHVLLRSRLATVLLTLTLLAWPLASAAQADPSPTFSGQATAVRATVLGMTTTLGDTGPLPSTGGSQEASLLNVAAAGVTAEVVHASTIGQGDRSGSQSSLASVNVAEAGHTVAADFLMSKSMAVCSSGSPSASGSSEIVGLVIDNQAVIVSGQPNQTVPLDGVGQVIINEQSSSRPGDITVNALHIIVTGVADVTIASAHADITCPPPPATPTCRGDFVTGGGWIIGTPSGAKANFAVAGGIKNGSFWGHLEYHDHGAGGPTVHGTGVTAYVVTGPTSRHIEGTAQVNGQSGLTYSADVTDNGSPGRNDTFAIVLSNGYSAAGNLGGGNITLHCP